MSFWDDLNRMFGFVDDNFLTYVIVGLFILFAIIWFSGGLR